MLTALPKIVTDHLSDQIYIIQGGIVDFEFRVLYQWVRRTHLLNTRDLAKRTDIASYVCRSPVGR